jgi:hypothetical protein
MSEIIRNITWQEETTKKNLHEAFGESKELSDWLLDSRCVVNEHTLDYRVRIKKLDLETALTTPSNRGKRWNSGELCEYNREGERNRWDEE